MIRFGSLIALAVVLTAGAARSQPPACATGQCQLRARAASAFGVGVPQAPPAAQTVRTRAVATSTVTAANRTVRFGPVRRLLGRR